MLNAPNADETEEHNELQRLSLEGLSAAYDDEPEDQLTRRKSVTPEARQTLLDELTTDLAHFESQYGMKSSDFNQRFEKGELGDAMDYFDWSAAFRMYTRIQSEQEVSE